LSTKRKPKILVVDDQPINIKLLQRKLERQDMNVLVAYNGRECLDIVEKELPDLILLDIMMPEMDGIETCQHLKANPATETIPIIFITAKASKEGKLEIRRPKRSPSSSSPRRPRKKESSKASTLAQSITSQNQST